MKTSYIHMTHVLLIFEMRYNLFLQPSISKKTITYSKNSIKLHAYVIESWSFAWIHLPTLGHNVVAVEKINAFLKDISCGHTD